VPFPQGTTETTLDDPVAPSFFSRPLRKEDGDFDFARAARLMWRGRPRPRSKTVHPASSSRRFSNVLNRVLEEMFLEAYRAESGTEIVAERISSVPTLTRGYRSPMPRDEFPSLVIAV